MALILTCENVKGRELFLWFRSPFGVGIFEPENELISKALTVSSQALLETFCSVSVTTEATDGNSPYNPLA